MGRTEKETATYTPGEWKAISHKEWGPSVVVEGETRQSLEGAAVPVFVAYRLRSMAEAHAIAAAPSLRKLALRLIKTFGDTPANELALQIAEDPSTLTDILSDARAVIHKAKVQS